MFFIKKFKKISLVHALHCSNYKIFFDSPLFKITLKCGSRGVAHIAISLRWSAKKWLKCLFKDNVISIVWMYWFLDPPLTLSKIYDSVLIQYFHFSHQKNWLSTFHWSIRRWQEDIEYSPRSRTNEVRDE